MQPPLSDEEMKECPHCGWIDNGVHLASYLYPKTFLAGRYIVGKLISYNGEAALYTGYDTFTEVKVTVKEYMPDALCSRTRDVLPLSVNSGELPLYKTYLSEFIELNRSLQSFGSLRGMQRVTDVFSENSTAYAIYEYTNSISIKSELQKAVGGCLSSARVKEIFPPVFLALSKINTAGIIHRGISPKTVFINEDSQLELTDFAITAARIYGSKLNAEVYAGYAAPEQYNSAERHGDWTDVYGLSALLYNALTGKVPQDVPSRLIKDELVAPMLVNGQIPAHISKAIMDGMELSAEKRVKTIGELSKLLWGTGHFSGATNSSTMSSTLTLPSIQSFKTVNMQSGLPITPDAEDVEIEFESEYPEADLEEAAELAELEARKLEREKKRKLKLIIALTVISAIVVLFVILIILAVAGVFDSDRRDNSSQTTTSVLRNITTPQTTSYVPPVLGEMEVTNFVGAMITESSMEEWAEKFDFLDFKFVARYSDERPKDIVYRQSIKRGEIVPEGTRITITYSLGPEFVQMPEFAGLTVEELTGRLIALGISLENIQVLKEESPVYTAAGLVDGSNFEAGDNIRLTSFPGDAARAADMVIIFEAVPLGGTTARTTKNRPATTLPPHNTTATPRNTTTSPHNVTSQPVATTTTRAATTTRTTTPPRATTPPRVTTAPHSTTASPVIE